MNQRRLLGYHRLVWVGCPDVWETQFGLHFQGHLIEGDALEYSSDNRHFMEHIHNNLIKLGL
jgi:hypothetical protein